MDILLEIKKQRDVQLEREQALLQRPSFKEALSKKGISIIGEIKRASPSKGQIANEQFDLIPQAQLYQQKGVAAFSILTEEAYFKGDNLFIPRVKEAIPTIPILRKDFIYTPFQVAHSKFLGASAIATVSSLSWAKRFSFTSVEVVSSRTDSGGVWVSTCWAALGGVVRSPIPVTSTPYITSTPLSGGGSK